MASSAGQEVHIEKYLALLKCKTAEDIPYCIRSRVMERMAPHCYNVHHTVDCNGVDHWMRAGCDVNSCTTTAAAVVHWLSPHPTGLPRTLSELPDRKPLTDFLATTAVDELLAVGRALYVFHTPGHKFVVLRVNEKAALLHSNQDDTRGGRKFTLKQFLDNDVGLSITIPFLTSMLINLAAAAAGIVPHEGVFWQYFRSRFKRGDKSDYWLVVLPLL